MNAGPPESPGVMLASSAGPEPGVVDSQQVPEGVVGGGAVVEVEGQEVGGVAQRGSQGLEAVFAPALGAEGIVHQVLAGGADASPP